MAHLTSNAPMPDELHGKDGAWTTRAPTSTPTSVPASTPAEVPARHMETRWNRGSVALAPRVPHVNEAHADRGHVWFNPSSIEEAAQVSLEGRRIF
ncbi:uncharacterized protein AB9W97_002005 isoform 2-T2 [Spinachia spinachia]